MIYAQYVCYTYSQIICFKSVVSATGQLMPGFLKLLCPQCQYMHVFVYVSLPHRLLITSGMIWTQYDWLNKFYNCYIVGSQ